ncbi:MAG: lipid-A-disaccharide synthase [Nitrospina sp.]|jgi:lipid-A-disaccharide synthase|nr:lipid-A-disaccharide synthase [Nitrospina sp.]MBT6601783.1 lipid-A-disaccharide synthase [Nitrospina sp.]
MVDESIRFLIIAGEASGDIHGGGLVRALKNYHPNCEFTGLGGDHMRREGVKTFYDIDRMGAIGVVEILGDLPHYLKVYRKLSYEIKSGRYDAVILIDYPTLNLRLAKLCKKYSCPALFFISPQVWAWRQGRIKEIKRTVSKMFVIFPFEEFLLKKEGVDAEFVGHPFIETVKTSMTRDEAMKKFSLDLKRKTIGLMPGSRNSELDFLLDLMINSAEEIKKHLKDCQFILPVANTLNPKIILDRLKTNPLEIRVIEGKSYDVMNCCDFIIIASGSATLEAGLLGCPMVIVYKLNWFTYWLARVLVKIKLYGLVNIVAGEEVVTELIQNKATVKNITKEVLRVMSNSEERESLRSRLLQVRKSLGDPGVLDRVAVRMIEFLRERRRNEKISI